MAAPADRKYLESHEWHKLDDDGNVVIGISQMAVDELTDITFVEIEATEGAIGKGESFGEIESVKATSELYCGIDGEVVAVNEDLLNDPSIINDDPYDKGWMIKVKPSDPEQLEGLLPAKTYQEKQGG
jgi:glycine cleavage system H protein